MKKMIESVLVQGGHYLRYSTGFINVSEWMGVPHLI